MLCYTYLSYFLKLKNPNDPRTKGALTFILRIKSIQRLGNCIGFFEMLRYIKKLIIAKFILKAPNYQGFFVNLRSSQIKSMDAKIIDFIQLNKLPEERFLPVLNFEGRFWVSDYGRILSYGGRVKLAILSPHLDERGYYAATLRMKPLKRKCRVHQLTGEHFCSMVFVPGHSMTWNHKDGNKLNNYYKNLEFITIGDNVRHAVETGLFNIKGEKHPQRKLTEIQVKEIRLLYTTGLTQKEIANKFGICRRQAGDIINRVNWGWLE